MDSERRERGNGQLEEKGERGRGARKEGRRERVNEMVMQRLIHCVLHSHFRTCFLMIQERKALLLPEERSGEK